MVPELAKRCSSPVKAISMKDGVPGNTYTLRTLTFEKTDKLEGRNSFRPWCKVKVGIFTQKDDSAVNLCTVLFTANNWLEFESLKTQSN